MPGGATGWQTLYGDGTTTQLPVQVWFTDDAKAHDSQFLDDLLHLATASTLLMLDRGFYDFAWWGQLLA